VVAKRANLRSRLVQTLGILVAPRRALISLAAGRALRAQNSKSGKKDSRVSRILKACEYFPVVLTYIELCDIYHMSLRVPLRVGGMGSRDYQVLIAGSF
jgi:hypothetical protein